MIHDKQKAKKIAIWAVLIIALVIVFGGYVFKNTDILEYKQQISATQALDGLVESIVPKTLEEKIEELKDEVRTKILNGESAGIVVEEGALFPTFDPYGAILDKCRRIGGKMDLDCLSFGQLQFKLSTIIKYEKDLNGNDITEMEALVIAHDTERASKLFDDIVYGVEGGIWNWSVAEHDKSYYNTVIPIIRKLIE